MHETFCETYAQAASAKTKARTEQVRACRAALCRQTLNNTDPQPRIKVFGQKSETFCEIRAGGKRKDKGTDRISPCLSGGALPPSLAQKAGFNFIQYIVCMNIK